ncbi:MAG TPA: acyl-CoA dehydrogenase family protein [Streptosporangiaceae bacterium]|jgi:alkylation response protein AidB-like acyl-CoA dehydrogenase|nr:acyl-CoA dehydrogenase family protein [Streptosporangiaceae bacterium]
MSEIAASEPRQTSVLENVRALLPEIKARAEEIEQARAVPRDLAEKLRTAGVFRRYVPRTHGGDEMWPDEGLTVIEELARADASVAWVAAVGSEGPSFYAYLPADTYDKIYAGGPDVIHTGVINATGKAVRDKGGYRFSGRWSFASGSNNADYVCIHGVLDGEQAGGAPATRLGVVPAREAQIDDVWHVSGLKGTASNDIVVSDLFIPDEWTGTFAELPPVARHPLDQRPLLARFGSEFAAVAVGIAQAALDDITDIARNKVPATSRSKLASDPVAQYLVGQLATDLYMARTLLHQVARDDQASVPLGPPDNTAMVIRRARLSRAASVAASVVESAYGVSGTTGLFESCPLQRRLRDVRAVTQHYMLSARSAFGPVGSAILSEESAG